VTALDTADLVVIAGQTLGIGTDAALARMDIAEAQAALAEAQAALAEARPAGQAPGTAFSDRAAAAAAGVGLMHALLRHRPFPQQNQQVAVAAGLQFLSLNGWRADLNPATITVVVVEALASGRLTRGDAAAWLSPRLSPAPHAHRVRRPPVGIPRSSPRLPRLPVPTLVPIGRAAASALLAVTVGGVAVLAAACSRAPDMSATTAARAPAVRQSLEPTRSADLAYAACMRTHGIENFPDPSASGVAALVPTAGIDPNSLQFRSAERTCQAIAPTAVIHIVAADAVP
jgi:prophage maintenance system killer protein